MCSAVSVMLEGGHPIVQPNATFSVIHQELLQEYSVDISQYYDLVFKLSAQWELDVGQVQCHWVAHLYAARMSDKGDEVRNYL